MVGFKEAPFFFFVKGEGEDLCVALAFTCSVECK